MNGRRISCGQQPLQRRAEAGRDRCAAHVHAAGYELATCAPDTVDHAAPARENKAIEDRVARTTTERALVVEGDEVGRRANRQAKSAAETRRLRATSHG